MPGGIEVIGRKILRHDLPDRFPWAWLVRVARKNVPMEVVALVPECLIIQFVRLHHPTDGGGDAGHVFEVLTPESGLQFVEFGRGLVAEKHRVASPVLVRAQNDEPALEFSDKARVFALSA